MQIAVNDEWIQVEGLPLNMWNIVAYVMIGSHFGGLVRVSDKTLTREGLKAAVLHVRGDAQQFFPSLLKVPSWGGLVPLKITTMAPVTTEGDAGHKFINAARGTMEIDGTKSRRGSAKRKRISRESADHQKRGTEKGYAWDFPTDQYEDGKRVEPDPTRDGSSPLKENLSKSHPGSKPSESIESMRFHCARQLIGDRHKSMKWASLAKQKHDKTPRLHTRNGHWDVSIDIWSRHAIHYLLDPFDEIEEDHVVADSENDSGSDMSILYIEERRQDELAESEADEESDENAEFVPNTLVDRSRYLIDENDLELIQQLFGSPKPQLQAEQEVSSMETGLQDEMPIVLFYKL
ncbi:hypothetical protein Scep_030901 [Stephania cephalantha]|uniref:DUF4283 domain-containing protein n=1 Tax=Stephania cephalantha TaxID=152367 RepID=A0AAP0E0I0_9MAGN